MHRRGLAVVVILLGACQRGRELSALRLEPLITLGADSGDGAMATTPSVSARHPGGFRVVAMPFSTTPSSPLLFDDHGTYLGALHGDSTASGTINQPRFTRFGPGDSIWVFGKRDVHVFDPSRRYVRTLSFSPSLEEEAPLVDVLDAAILHDNRVAAITQLPVPAELLSATGVVEHNIPVQERHGPQLPSATAYRIAPAPDGTFWTTSITAPWHMEHWDTAARRVGSLDLTAAWLVDSNETEQLRRWNRRSFGVSDLSPAPSIQAIWFDDAGRLWVLGAVSDRHWQKGLVVDASTGHHHIEPDRYYDTVVEVRDAGTGAVIATARFDISCRSIAGPGELVHEVVTRAGWVRAELFRVVLDENALHMAR